MKKLFQTVVLVAVLTFSGCCAFASGQQKSFVALDKATASNRFIVIGDKKGAMYQKIMGFFSGEPVKISIKRISHYANVGGMNIETNPTFTISGVQSSSAMALDVETEDIIANVGGMNVQVDVVYHVKGKIGGTNIGYDIRTKETISDLGGMKVVTDSWKEIVSGSKVVLTFKSVSETANVGGIEMVTNRYSTVSGQDAAGKVAIRIDGFETDSVNVSGSASSMTVALVLGLRPFLVH